MDNNSAPDQIVNEKAQAWELIGDQFWTIGRVAARPSEREEAIFLETIDPGHKVCIVGASSKFLIEKAVEIGAEVTVLDFSERMCNDLAKSLTQKNISIRVVDITKPVPVDLAGTFDAVLNDRLINRFSTKEAILACRGMLQLAAPGGIVRASVKLGFYDIDLRLLEYGKEAGNLDKFYDVRDKTFYFAMAGDVLDRAVVPHGEIDKDTLLKWYRLRGKETRFDDEDVLDLLASPELGGKGKVQLQTSIPFPDAPKTQMYQFSSTA
ncbi:MAG: class I SAM-dependent methyltransferase [Rhodobacteraceae bacterium]|nr:class I SAM-dependent methyltransferase [Paracoccaceae bacterium]